jgi:hypothetical protein
MQVTCSSEKLVDYNGLHGVVTQKLDFLKMMATSPIVLNTFYPIVIQYQKGEKL